MSENDAAFHRSDLATAKRIVVKVGSSLLTSLEAGLAREEIGQYCREIAVLMTAGKEIIMVSSGSIAEGCKRLGWTSRPDEVHRLQAAAAVGQIGLMQAYEEALKEHGCGSAMILLTHDDLADRQRYLNARATLKTLMDVSVVPIINENDTVATDEIRFGDNDTLGALVANLVEADLLIILTDVAGLLSADPRVDPAAKRIESALATDQSLTNLVSGGAGALGRGGGHQAGRCASRCTFWRPYAHCFWRGAKNIDANSGWRRLRYLAAGRGICDDRAKALDRRTASGEGRHCDRQWRRTHFDSTGSACLPWVLWVFEVIFDAVMWCGVWIKTTRLLPRLE